MPSIKDLVKTSISLTSLSFSRPESVAITSPSTGEQLFGYFSGWTTDLTLAGGETREHVHSASVLAPLTVFTSTEDTTTCSWVKSQVEAYKAYDDVFEELFLQGTNLLSIRILSEAH